MRSEKDAIQKAKEYGWIIKHILEAKTIEEEKKWRGKMENWRKANPSYAAAVDQHLDRVMDERIQKMTMEEKVNLLNGLEEEQERRKKNGLMRGDLDG